MSNSVSNKYELAHDPLCPTVNIKNKTVTYEFGSCSCDLIARVREDELNKDYDYRYVTAYAEAEGYYRGIKEAQQIVLNYSEERLVETEYPNRSEDITAALRVAAERIYLKGYHE